MVVHAALMFLLFRLGGMSASSTSPAAGPIFVFGVMPFLLLVAGFIYTFKTKQK